MRPLAELRVQGLRGVLFDIDDTLSTEGRLTAAAYAALERLKDAGLVTIPITGRPAGWCDHIARMWPVDAVVGENGAFYFCRDRDRLAKRFLDAAPVREANRARLQAIAASILAQVPGCAIASDQGCRETDLAIDFCEDVPALPLAEAERIATLMRAAGLTAKVSSIHVNGWFGDYDKLATTKLLLRERYALELADVNPELVFVGDSPNDAPMFAYFSHSVGVANVARFAGRLEAEPAYITRGEAGEGFVELAAHLLGR